MTARERPIPAATSGLAPQPTLTPKVKPLRVGDGGDRQEQEDQEPAPHATRRPGRTRGGRQPAPVADGAKAATVRFDPEEASAVDRFVLDLRDEAGRRQLDKAEVIRELLRLAREHDGTRRALLRRLR